MPSKRSNEPPAMPMTETRPPDMVTLRGWSFDNNFDQPDTVQLEYIAYWADTECNIARSGIFHQRFTGSKYTPAIKETLTSMMHENAHYSTVASALVLLGFELDEDDAEARIWMDKETRT